MPGSELESMAANYARQAMKLDKQGSRSLAVIKYQRAIEILLKLCQIYPDQQSNPTYLKHIEAYSSRVRALQRQTSDSGKQEKSEKEPNEFILTEKPDVQWEDVVGLESAKKAVEESIIFPVKRADLFPLGWPRGILLFGPSGCGKTLLAAAVSSQIDATFFYVDAASIMSKWLGESEKNVSKLFSASRKAADNSKPAIIFIDEIDSMTSVQKEEVGGEIRARNQFLREMDSLVDKKKRLHIYVIGATNKPWNLDEAFIRRFQKRIMVPLPDSEARREMFEMYTRGLELGEDVDLKELAETTEGYSGSDIHDLCQAVQMKVVREFFETIENEDDTRKPRMLSLSDFQNVLENRKPSVTPYMLYNFQRWADEFKAH
ncbi:MAG: AAA family ATPase [Candidatus Bathyarchaeota archaeon]|nr:MAG: AAA family ATPase [Candidatus Bathyarchaeota archaeon]